MSGQALQAELTSLAQEAKRRNPEIRTAAEKSLQDLKSLPSTSEQQLAADLSRRPNFIDPFLIACNTRNAKYASSAAVCLQRLVNIRGLPKSRLKDVLDAFNACTSLSLDIQLKVLQALPALAQNYADDLKGEHLAAALQVCAALQNVKAATVSGVAAATLQQLVVSVFDRVSIEDDVATQVPVVVEVPGDGGNIALREAAHDAYRVFMDICLAIEGQRTKFVRFEGLSVASGLELMGACLGSHPKIFATHPEQTAILRTLVMPHLIRMISERPAFGVTLRALRVASFIIRQHLQAMPDECEVVLGLLTHMIDSEAATSWKRAMCMEVFRIIYTEPGLAVQVYLQFDAQDGKKSIVRDNIASFVRLSTEKPALIGLGQHSTDPTGTTRESIAEQVAVEAAGGVAGIIGAPVSVTEANTPGISTRWSLPKNPCLDQLDKTDPPPLPDTYIYSLVLECLNGLSENLAKVVLPLTVQHEGSRHKNHREHDEDENDGDETETPRRTQIRKKRSQSYRSRTVPLNPLSSDDSAGAVRIRGIAGLVDECWPALLATYSTFLNASLDSDYYRALIKSFQRFVQVSGLLRLSTARDAFLTTLGKAAVPPSLVTSSISVVSSPGGENPGVYSNPKGLLSVESFTSQVSANDKSTRRSHDPLSKPTLSTRNLLCLRALLNVAIAIGPTLETSFTIIFETLLQAGVVLNASQGNRDSRSSGLDSEIAAVEAAVTRLFESTADYPNDAFLHVLTTLCGLLDGKAQNISMPNQDKHRTHTRRLSSLPGISTDIALSAQDYLFVLTRIGELADLNTPRFVGYTLSDSGWKILVDRVIDLSITASVPDDARRLAADILTRCAVAVAGASTAENSEDASVAQKMVLSSLHMLVRQLYEQGDNLTNLDIEIHNKILEAVKAILEKSGEALTAGWDIILAILGGVFDEADQSDDAAEEGEDGWLKLSSNFIAPHLGRSAFGVMQLICSDFLAPLPETCISPLVEILYHFASQDADLNISLTTISLFWDVSDFLVKQDVIPGLNELVSSLSEERLVPGHRRIAAKSKESRPAQWVLLLYRLADTISDPRSEVRNSAFQTLMRIFSNHSGDFSVPAWQLATETLLFRMLRENSEKQTMIRSEKVSPGDIVALDSTTNVLVAEIASLLTGQFSHLTSSSSFDRLWVELIEILQGYLTYHSSVINTAVYGGLSTLLKAFGTDDPKLNSATQHVVSLWSSAIPNSSADVKGQDAEQDAFLAYIACGGELYLLIEKNTTADQIAKLVRNMVDCVRSSSGAAYGVDINSPTPLQKKVLENLEMLHGNINLVHSLLVNTAAELIALPFNSSQNPRPKTGLTFVALSKLSIDWVVQLTTSPLAKPEMLHSGAIASALESLAIPITLKYSWTQNGKPPSPWQKATSAALSIIEKTLAQMEQVNLAQDMKTRVWKAIINIACAIMTANLETGAASPSIETIEKDEEADCTSLNKLKKMMTSALSSPDIPDDIRQTYTKSLFHASLIHAVERGDIPQGSPLSNIYTLRIGRVRDPEPSLREDMAYLCFSELISLVKETGRQRVELARAAVPFLILRFALPLKAYVVDQPLRGSMPTPLSQVEELLFCLEEMDGLRCESGVLVDSKGRDAKGADAHLEMLYPLVVKAVGVAGDRRFGNKKVLGSLQRVLDACRWVG